MKNCQHIPLAVAYLLVILHVVLFTACTAVREYPLETLQPASLVLNEPNRSIALYAPSSLFDYSVMANEEVSEDISTDSLTFNILYSLKNFIENAPGFGNSTVNVFIADNPAQVPEEADWYVGVTRLQIANTYYSVPYHWEAKFYAHYVFVCNVENADKSFSDDFVERDMQDWSSRITEWGTSQLPSVADAWWDLGIALARTCAEHVTPHWRNETRKIYLISRFNDDSALAYKAMRDNNYNRAFALWEEMLISCRKGKQKKIKSRIAYNLAVVCEMQNQFDDALHWIQQSIAYSANQDNNQYLKKLKERQGIQVIQ
jgi:tetratricopeptide (TPR) repeat protein